MSFLTGGVAFLLAAFVVWRLYAILLSKISNIPRVATLPLLGSIAFWTRRYDFLMEGVKKYGSVFAFKVLQHDVYCVTGDEARQVFFKTPESSVSFGLGYKVLFKAPRASAEPEDEQQSAERSKLFHQHIVKLLAKRNIDHAIPGWVADTMALCDRIGESGKMEPFLTIYRLVFQMSCRMVASREVYDDFSEVEKLNDLFWKLEGASSASAVLFPDFIPCQARDDAKKATGQVFQIIASIVQKRKASNNKEDDPLQYLLDANMTAPEIMQFVVTALFAAVINSGIMSTWLLLFLVQHSQWRDRVMGEFLSVVQGKGGAEGLSSLTVDTIEQLPVLEACVKETLRYVMSGSAFRKVIDKAGVTIDGKHIPCGSFLTSPLGHIHLNDKVWSNPYTFDPARFLPPRNENHNAELSFIGWGVGRHPCLGMKMALYEIKVLVLTLLSMYDFNITSGPLPGPDRNSTHSSVPSAQVSLQYQRRSKFGYSFSNTEHSNSAAAPGNDIDLKSQY